MFLLIPFPNKSYPVLYLQDPDTHFDILVEFTKLFSKQDVDDAPPLIIVGIENTNRSRDLTPTNSNINYAGEVDSSANSWMSKTGGNEPFLKFIRDELMPFINATQKTQPYSIFAGHSFETLSTINCLINYTDMFNAYIAISPSFWWDQKNLLKSASIKLTNATLLDKSLFLCDGNEGVVDKTSFNSDVLKFDSLLNQRPIQGLDFKYIHYPEESHATVPVKGYYDALRFIFRQWHRPLLSDKEVDSELIMKHYRALSKKFGYTILPDEQYFDGWGNWLIRKATTFNNGISLLEMNTINYPSSPKAFISLGDAFAKNRDKKKALDAYNKAKALNPRSKEIIERIKQVQ